MVGAISCTDHCLIPLVLRSCSKQAKSTIILKIERSPNKSITLSTSTDGVRRSDNTTTRKYHNMPPRKRPKLSPRASSSTPQVETTKQPSSAHSTTDSAQKSDTEYDLVNDPWTDEQETALLKSIVRWKPVGIHAFPDFLRSQVTIVDLWWQECTNILGCWL